MTVRVSGLGLGLGLGDLVLGLGRVELLILADVRLASFGAVPVRGVST